jgi:hypothetical protein
MWRAYNVNCICAFWSLKMCIICLWIRFLLMRELSLVVLIPLSNIHTRPNCFCLRYVGLYVITVFKNLLYNLFLYSFIIRMYTCTMYTFYVYQVCEVMEIRWVVGLSNYLIQWKNECWNLLFFYYKFYVLVDICKPFGSIQRGADWCIRPLVTLFIKPTSRCVRILA